MKNFLLAIWNYLFDLKNRIWNGALVAFSFVYRKAARPLVVKGIDDTIEYIIKNKCSVSRFGDGEIKLAAGKSISFQKASSFVTEKMREVLGSDSNGHIVAVADVFSGCADMTEEARAHWKKHLARYTRTWYRHTKKGKVYYNAFMSRPYMSFADKGSCKKTFALLKKIWEGQDIVFIEGEKSRLGVGNDLFDNAKSIQRILGPATDAFDKYNELLEYAKRVDKARLLILALGPCATALSYDLHLLGYRAIDLGHADIEYEWFLQGATEKTPVKNKFVNEAGAGKDVGDLNDSVYLSQIIARVGLDD